MKGPAEAGHYVTVRLKPDTTYRMLRLAIREEVRRHEGFERGLVGLVDARELEAHSHSAVCPRDLSFCVDVVLALRHSESHLHDRAHLERVRGAHGDSAC